MEDQRRRTLEALERRFAQAKSEVQSQKQNSKKRPAEDKKTVALHVESLSADSPINKPLSKSSSKRGKFSFTDHTSKEDTGLNEPAYLKLSHSVHENLLPNGAQVSDGRITVNGVLHELFQHGDSAKKYMQGSKSIKIENTILLDNYVHKHGSSSSGHIQALQHGSKRSKKHMSLKQHKSIGSFDLPKEFHNFNIFKPMHEKWKSYVHQLLRIVGKGQLAQCFLNADLHGAIILGLHGIMVRETKETFGIVTQDNKFKVVPKKLSVFMLQADCWKVTLHGDRLVSRNLVP
ncbi:ribonuclease MRP protein subunit POP4 isoform X2 [Salvia miltiorrhiza]|uniref:ribonuclease MRP protein subunit POP4 isoform X2 n=1 Tax=Salvia miltiorrhiza TaxID=226208 RepID=UPI0025AC4FDB|nr:ribonuclease MRP protein subunit POP4 isoform X2 [Salvia miltiorrhiza]